MVDTGIFASNAQVARKAGANVNTTSIGSDYTNQYLSEAESYINSVCRFNFSDVYDSLNDDTKKILQECASNIAAIYSITYDLSGYTSRIEAEDMINVLRDAYLRDLQVLRDKKVSDFVREEV
jgi:hypothetical protein